MGLGNCNHNMLFIPDNNKQYIIKSDDENLKNPNSPFYYIINAISDNSQVLDVGCSYGYLGEFLHKNKNCGIYGIDINSTAADSVRKGGYYKDVFVLDLDYPEKNKNELNRFINSTEQFDFVVCADLLEHLKDPTRVLNFVSSKLKYGGQAFISIPNIANLDIIMNLIEGRFNYSEYGILDNTHLRFFTKSSFIEWIYYANKGFQDFKFDLELLGRTSYNSDFILRIKNDYPEVYEILARSIEEYNVLQYIFILTKINDHSVVYNLDKFISSYNNKSIENINTKLLNKCNQVLYLQNKDEESAKQIALLEKEINNRNLEIAKLKEANDAVITSNENKIKELNGIVSYKDNEINKIKYQLDLIYRSHFWKVALKYYKLRDNIWPFNQIYRYLKNKRLKNALGKTEGPNEIACVNSIDNRHIHIPNVKNLQLNEYKKYDVIIFSIINWDYRYQRPQHIASFMNKAGHRVFYINANFDNQHISINANQNGINVVTLYNNLCNRIYDANINENIEVFVEQLDDIIQKYSIKDCVLIVNYPTWQPIIEYIKTKYGFNVMFDYLDDYTGFNTFNDNLKDFTRRLFDITNCVISSSKYLFDKAKEFSNNVMIVRNGTEHLHFAKALTTSNKNLRPVIGYYGAIAEWFDVEKILFLAKKKPEWDIVLIGDATYANTDKMRAYKNIKLLGEKNYNELPEYLADFDVCLIPFKADIDLIKATNPVKFYEYLSAGKKVVATEIPELLPFKNELVYLSNNDEVFLKHVEDCINDTDSLLPVKERVEFAKKQDWINRCKDIQSIIRDVYDKVSIVIVTYNNISYTKSCIESIINKTAYPNYEIILVDNNSNDNSQDYLRELGNRYQNIKVILNDDNLGFAKANNIGIKNAEGDYIILLNNDTVVTRGWITNLVKHLKSNERLGIIGPITNSIGNEAKINTAYNSLQEMDCFAEEYSKTHFNELYKNINVLAMFCVAIKRDVIDKVGYLDEDFGIGMFEDDDYSYRVRKSGYEIACAEDVFIHHYGSVSFKKLEDSTYRRLFEENKAKFEHKWNIKWSPHKYREGIL